MRLEPLPRLLRPFYDEDSLIYKNDDTLYYATKVPPSLIRDLKNKQFQIYNGTYKLEKGKEHPVIYLNGRGKETGKIIFTVEGFLPYYYIPSENGDYITYKGYKVEKILLENSPPKRVADIRKYYERQGYGQFQIPHEADIPFVRRFLIDMYDYFKSEEYIEPKVCIFDIETDYPVSNDIISFALNDYDGNLYFTSIYEQNKYEIVLDLYTRLVEYDIVANWNVDFDISALRIKLEQFYGALRPIEDGYKLSKENYIKKLALDYNLYGYEKAEKIVDALIKYRILKDEDGILSPGFYYHLMMLDKNLEFIVTPFDLLEISKKMYAKEINGSWSLDNTGIQLCGIGKFELDGKYPRELSEEELLEYNVMDVIIPEVIDNYLGGIQCHIILAWSLQSLVKDVFITAVVNDIALLRAYHKAGIVLPSRPPFNLSSDETYKAAEPDARPGVYNNVAAFDLHAAYPSAVIAINASAETKDKNGDLIAPNGVRFNTNKSVFIDTLKELLNEREKIKAKLKTIDKKSSEYKTLKNIDFALKTQVAAFSHGIFGWSNSRMKDIEVADAITSTVRSLINKIKKTADESGFPWCYLHTDSCYVVAKSKDNIDYIHKLLNNTIKEYCMKENYLYIPRLDFKGFYPKVYIHSPARNVLVDEDGEWYVTGMNFMRSEVPEPLREIEIEMIKMKLDGKSIDEMMDTLRTMIINLKNTPSSKLGIVKPLNKPISKYGRKGKNGNIVGFPYHINALLRAKEEYGLDIKVGEKFRVLPIITDEFEGVRVIRRKRVYIAYPLNEELPEQYEIDFQNYLRSNLWGKISSIFEMTPKELEDVVCNEYVKSYLHFVE